MHPIDEELQAALGAVPERLESISGGCINQAYRCVLSDGRRVFVKCNEDCDAQMFHAEAAGLAWLAEANALAVPTVLAVGETFLALELHENGRPSADYQAQFGRGLAKLHRHGADRFGFAEQGFIATLPQDNRETSDWPSFYSQRRLQPLLHTAVDQGLAPKSWIDSFDSLFARMPELVGETEAPSRLHGDLWTGNVHTSNTGLPMLIDPACYAGHREVDLAMLRLFGSPSASFMAAYQDIWPLAPGHQDRVALYQLYPLLVHLILFGSGYREPCQQALHKYL